jgi:hypothetical protein
MKTLATLSFALLLSVPAFAKGRDYQCSNAETADPENGAFTLTVSSAEEVEIQDGGELSAGYKADPSKDTAGYKAYKIIAKDQDGEQPAEVKVAKGLISGKEKDGGVWLAPGIVGGAFHCFK